ncbi:MAG: hypothetical protein IKZ43_11365 [Acidaminococcaceae bacterium]|nr:hypothetical protein [Acidaminococcaceae bacterium]
MKKSVIAALVLCTLVIFTGCGSTPKNAENDKNAKPAATEQIKPAAGTEKGPEAKTPAENTGNAKEQKVLGAISPEQALEYMKKTKNLVIVDVAPRKAYDKGHFIGAISIPIEGLSKEEEDKRYKELIPAGKPVLIHCRRAIFAPNAYKRIVELRPDIPEISYINGAPLMQPYNEWKSTQGN